MTTIGTDSAELKVYHSADTWDGFCLKAKDGQQCVLLLRVILTQGSDHGNFTVAPQCLAGVVADVVAGVVTSVVAGVVTGLVAGVVTGVV